MSTKDKWALLSAVSLSITMAAPVWARAAADDISAIDQIIVTSTRREENIQDVPVAVTVISGAYLEVAAPQNLLDATGLAPNLFIGSQTAGPGMGAIYSRGLGYADIEKTQSPAVGVSVDGVFLGSNTGQLADLFDVAQVEINRGPQGLLFGKNTTGGVIDIKRTRPTDEMGVRAQFSYGSFDEFAAKAVLNSGRMFGDLAALKIGVGYRESEGYYKNLYDGTTLGDIDQLSINASLALDPTEDLSIYLIFDYSDDESETTPVQAENTLSLPGVPGANGLSEFQTLADIDQPIDFETTRISAEINWDTPIGVLTSISAYISSSDDVTQDFDSTCLSDVGGLGCRFAPNPRLQAPSLHIQRDSTNRQFSQEIRLASDWTEAFRTVVGFYYFESSVQLTAFTDLSLELFLLPASISKQDSHEDTESVAYFAQAEVDITDALTVSGGLRFISEDKAFASQFDSFAKLGSLTPGAFAGVLVPFFDDNASFNETITKFGIDYRIDENHLIYFTRAEGFRSGGFSIRATLSETLPPPSAQPNFSGTERFNTYLPEEATTYEIGSKNVLLGGDLVLNLTGFYQELNGQQANFVVNTTPGTGTGTNTYNNNYQETAGWGLELEGSWTTPIDGLSVRASFGYQDIEIEEALVDARRVPVGTAFPGAPGTSGKVDFSALDLSRTPDYTGSVTALYQSELSNGMGYGGQVSFRYQDNFTLANLGTISDLEGAYGIWDASVYLDVTERIKLAFFARNLRNEKYRANALPSLGFQSFARPRTVYGQVTIEY